MKMSWSGTGSLLVFIFLLFSGVQSEEPEKPPPSGASGGLSVPWHDELCCDSPGAHIIAEERPLEQDTHPLRFSQCNFRSERHHNSSGGLCADVMCRIREDWSALTCELRSNHSAFSAAAISLQPVLSAAERITASEDPVICEGNSSLKCSLVLGAMNSDVVLNVTIANVTSSPVHLKVPTAPVKPGAPVNVSHHQTIEAELVLTWDPPPGAWGQLRYEVRYRPETPAAWKVLQAFEPRMLLDLEVRVVFEIQVRGSSLVEPPVWSDWSHLHHISLDIVSYIPEVLKGRPDEAVTLYCVFNDRTFEAKSARWTLNYQEPIQISQYRPVNQWVSQVTVKPSKSHMYELLQCTQAEVIAYSKIYVEGADIAITCQTNGDINVMDCSWKNKELAIPKFKSKWADMLCEEMERREKAGEELGTPDPVGQECSNQRSCRIQPLRMNCYKLWLEMDSPLGPISSKPIYLSPVDHVKPRTASNVAAVSRRSGFLSVTWDPPRLPVQGVTCQFRFHAPSTVGQPVWSVQPAVLAHSGEVSIPNMCVSYAVQVQCKPTNGSGYWSDWSKTIYSVPQNSQAPERGPDFWRVYSDDPSGNQTTVTLLFEHLQTSGLSYCVDGLIIRYQPQSGPATEDRIGFKSSHSFQWNHEVQTVTVETYNSRGRSANNFNITLNKKLKHGAVRSFHVVLVNTSCASVSWSVLNTSSVPQFMVLQWTHSHQEIHKNPLNWRRLRYTDQPVYIQGNFFGLEKYDFSLYPVFADGEGHPVHTKAVRRDPGAYMLLMIISFLSVLLLVTLVLSQNQMKRIVWKDVPNPNKCSWAKEVDFKKVDSFDHVLRAPETLSAWPVLLPSENISTVVIMDKPNLSALVQPPLDPSTSEVLDHFHPQDTEKLLTEDMDLLHPERGSLLLLSERMDDAQDTSAQSSVNYAIVQPSDAQMKLHYQDGSSCDEGNFSANNSDISDSSHGALWELESCRAGNSDTDKRRSGSSYNSVEELSESSNQEDNDRQEKDLYYLTLLREDSDEEEQEKSQKSLLKSIVFSKDNCSYALFDTEEDSNEKIELLSAAPCGSSPLYLPQFRTAPDTNESQL